MATKSLKDRLSEALEDVDTKAYLPSFVTGVRENLIAIDEKIDRLLVRLFLLTAAMGLLAGAAVPELSLGFVTIRDLRLPTIFLPVLMAYTYYEIASALSHRRLLKVCLGQTIAKLYPPIYTNDLEFYLEPPSPVTIHQFFLLSGRRVPTALIGFFGVIIALAVLFLPCLLVIVALLRIVWLYGLLSFSVLLSVAVSLILLLQGILFVWYGDRLT